MIIKRHITRIKDCDDYADDQTWLGEHHFDNYVTISAKLDVAGSKADKVTTVAAATYTIAITDRTIVVDYTSTGAVTLTLPSCATAWNSDGNTGIVFVIKDLDCNAGANNITINRAGSDTIIDTAAGQTSTVINGDGNAIRIQAVSTTEWIVF